jgi:hypothetical protein
VISFAEGGTRRGRGFAYPATEHSVASQRNCGDPQTRHAGAPRGGCQTADWSLGPFPFASRSNRSITSSSDQFWLPLAHVARSHTVTGTIWGTVFERIAPTKHGVRAVETRRTRCEPDNPAPAESEHAARGSWQNPLVEGDSDEGRSTAPVTDGARSVPRDAPEVKVMFLGPGAYPRSRTVNVADTSRSNRRAARASGSRRDSVGTAL